MEETVPCWRLLQAKAPAVPLLLPWLWPCFAAGDTWVCHSLSPRQLWVWQLPWGTQACWQ